MIPIAASGFVGGSNPIGLQPLLGPLLTPPGLLFALVVVLIVLLLGRVLIGIAWRLILIALVVVLVIWIFSMLGSIL